MAPLPPDAHLVEPLLRWARDEPAHPLAAIRVGDRFQPVPASAVHARVRELAKGLIGAGVAPGDRVVLMSRSRLEWVLVDYAILAAGAVTVPVYETSSGDQVRWIVEDSDAALCVVETEAMQALAARARPARGERPTFVIDAAGLDARAERARTVPDGALDERIGALRGADLASIVYTSGTTGLPKGCMLTHRALRTNAAQTLDAVRGMLGPDEASLIFLPLAHALTRIVMLAGVEWGITLAFATSTAHLDEELALARPTLIVAVPRVFEKVFAAGRRRAAEQGRARVFDAAVRVAIRWSTESGAGRPGLVTAAGHAVFDRLVYRKLRAALGGRLRFAFSGGGPLGERLTRFFHGVGVQVFEGYGLTETSPTLTVNRADAWKPGTVGRPLAGTTIGIAPDGEILARGPQVFEGYWRDEEATAEVFENGWFRTGDLGELDGDGFLRITGRKKDVIVTAAGKNVAPEPLEERLRAHPLISQAVVVGEGRPFVAAVLTVDEGAVRKWARDRGAGDRPLADLLEDPALLDALQRAVDEANRPVSRAESIRRFAVLPRDLTVEAGELTPTEKVRRARVVEAYRDVIERLYTSGAG